MAPEVSEPDFRRTEFLDLMFDSLSIEQTLTGLAQRPGRCPFQFVVTPNVDHVVRLHDPEQGRELREAYPLATLRLCDSRVLVRLARLYGVRLTLVPGSDLTAELFRQVIGRGDRIAIVGGDDRTVERLQIDYPDIEFIQHIPPMGLRHNPRAVEAAADFVQRTRARFTFFAVGSPQQEMIAAAVAVRDGAVGVGLCIGASIDFLTGQDRRAPRFMQRLGFEWAHRLAANPRRMWRRYLVEGPKVFVLAIEWHGRQLRSEDRT